MFSLQSSDIDDIFFLVQRITDINSKYDAFVVSTEHEMTNIEKNFNAQLLSRTGFVFQEIKDLEFQVANEISEAGVSPECVLQANAILANGSAWAGSNSMPAYLDVTQRIYFSRYVEVYPTLTELKKLMSTYTVEALAMLGYLNPVTRMGNILEIMLYEFEVFDILFEDFVDQIIHEMQVFDVYSRELFRILNNSLGQSRVGFLSSADQVRELIANDCA